MKVHKHLRYEGLLIILVWMINQVALAAPMEEANTESSGNPADVLAIDEGSFVNINGYEQWITIRGRSLENPVFLWIHGGPGGAGMSAWAPVFEEWEHYYTIVQWDQPGTGTTSAHNLDKDTGDLSIRRFVQDGLAVTEYIRERLHKDKVLLMGISWGSLVSLEMVHEKPEYFSAYVGTAQHVSGPSGRLLGYELALQAATARGDEAAVAALTQAGPPPYDSLEDYIVRQQYTNPPGLPGTPIEVEKSRAFIKAITAPPPAGASYIPDNLPEIDGVGVFMQITEASFRQVQKWEASDLGTSFSVPVFIFQGENDINTPTVLAMEFCRELTAPAKACAVIPGAGHSTLAFNEHLLVLLNSLVRPFI